MRIYLSFFILFAKEMVMVRFLSAGTSHVGFLRTNNEDAYLAVPEAGFFAISDGMGGQAAGEIASQYFIETAQSAFGTLVSNSGEADIAWVEKVFRRANETILEYAAQNPDDLGMGCTGEILVFYGSHYIIGHVGDSRIYVLRDGVLRQLTKDHSLVQLQVDQGMLTSEEAKTHPKKNIILRAVGTHPSVSCDILRGEGLNHDIFLLCTDGLTDLVNDSQIQSVLLSPSPVQQKVERLIEAALLAGGKDNVTVVLCEVQIEDRGEQAL
jgi:protein phosphatase